MKKKIIIFCLLIYTIAGQALAQEIATTTTSTTGATTTSTVTSTIPTTDDDVTLNDIGIDENGTTTPSTNQYVALRNKYIKSLKIHGKIGEVRANNIKKMLDLRFKLWRSKILGKIKSDTNASSTVATSKEAKNLNSIIEALIRQSQNLKDRAIKSEFIPDSLEQSISKEITEDISKLNSYKDQIKNSTSTESLKDIRSKLATYKKDFLQIRLKKVLALINIGKLELNYGKKIEDKYLAIKDKLGNDIEQGLKDKLNEAKAIIDQAKLDLQSLRNQMNTKPLSELINREITKELVEILKKFNEAKKILNDIKMPI
ncbi:hypothetical protein KBC01_02620 [Candidatus Parcubacteria bacterium]|nr:hypothetical protein [Candidatus Parcubacteria bacterium]HPM08707.1 hypothetical protein [Candidatus Pacearchaeota archaeon]